MPVRPGSWNGAAGTWSSPWARAERLYHREAAPEPIPAAPAQAVDTAGAGDCFSGWLAVGLAAAAAQAEAAGPLPDGRGLSSLCAEAGPLALGPSGAMPRASATSEAARLMTLLCSACQFLSCSSRLL